MNASNLTEAASTYLAAVVARPSARTTPSIALELERAGYGEMNGNEDDDLVRFFPGQAGYEAAEAVSA